MPSYRGYRFPPEIISHAVWLYHRFSLSLPGRRRSPRGARDHGDLRNDPPVVSDVRARLRTAVTAPPGPQGPQGPQGRHLASGRGIRQDPGAAAVSVACRRRGRRRNRRAALRFFRKLLKGQGCVPRRLITDKLRSYPAACRTVMPSVVHRTDRYANNRAEVSHQPTRERERQMRRFTSAAHAQRFLSVHGPIQNLFRVGRHLLRAVHHRLLRTRAFGV